MSWINSGALVVDGGLTVLIMVSMLDPGPARLESISPMMPGCEFVGSAVMIPDRGSRPLKMPPMTSGRVTVGMGTCGSEGKGRPDRAPSPDRIPPTALSTFRRDWLARSEKTPSTKLPRAIDGNTVGSTWGTVGTATEVMIGLFKPDSKPLIRLSIPTEIDGNAPGRAFDRLGTMKGGITGLCNAESSPLARLSTKFPGTLDGKAVGRGFGLFEFPRDIIAGVCKADISPLTMSPITLDTGAVGSNPGMPIKGDISGFTIPDTTPAITLSKTLGCERVGSGPGKLVKGEASGFTIPERIPPTRLSTRSGCEGVGSTPGMFVRGEMTGFTTSETIPATALSKTLGTGLGGSDPGTFVRGERTPPTALSKKFGTDIVGSDPGMFVRGDMTGFTIPEASPPASPKTLGSAPLRSDSKPLKRFGALAGTGGVWSEIVGSDRGFGVGRLFNGERRSDTRPPTTPSTMLGREALGPIGAAVGIVRAPGSPRPGRMPRILLRCVGTGIVTGSGGRELAMFKPDANPSIISPTTFGMEDAACGADGSAVGTPPRPKPESRPPRGEDSPSSRPGPLFAVFEAEAGGIAEGTAILKEGRPNAGIDNAGRSIDGS